jgi:hypothetical protein
VTFWTSLKSPTSAEKLNTLIWCLWSLDVCVSSFSFRSWQNAESDRFWDVVDGFSMNGGTPIAGWFISWTRPLLNDFEKGTPMTKRKPPHGTQRTTQSQKALAEKDAMECSSERRSDPNYGHVRFSAVKWSPATLFGLLFIKVFLIPRLIVYKARMVALATTEMGLVWRLAKNGAYWVAW